MVHFTYFTHYDFLETSVECFVREEGQCNGLRGECRLLRSLCTSSVYYRRCGIQAYDESCWWLEA